MGVYKVLRDPRGRRSRLIDHVILMNINIRWQDVSSLIGLSWHDDVIKWKYFPCYWPFVRGIHRSPVASNHKGQWREALMLSLVCTWTNGWENNRDACDLTRHRAHHDVIVMGLKLHPRDGNWCILGSDNDLMHTRHQAFLYTHGELSIVKWVNFELNHFPLTNKVLTHQTIISSIFHWTKTSYLWEQSYWISFL